MWANQDLSALSGLTYSNRCTKALAKQSTAKFLCPQYPLLSFSHSPPCKKQHELSPVEPQPKPKPKPKQAKQIRQQLTRLEASQHSSSYSHNFRRLVSSSSLPACPTVHLSTVGRTGPKCRCQWLIYANGHNKWGAYCQLREGERGRVDESKLGAWGESNWMPTAQWKRLIWCWTHSCSHSQRRDAIRNGLSLRGVWKRQGDGEGRRRRQKSSVLLNRAQSPGNGHGNGDCMMTGSRKGRPGKGPGPGEVMELGRGIASKQRERHDQ